MARRHVVALAVIVLACYAYFFPRWADWNQNSRFDLVQAVVVDGTLAIDRYVANTGDYAYYGGHYYSDKAPGTALLGIPIYALFRALVPYSLMEHLGTGALQNQAVSATLKEMGTGLLPEKLYASVGLAFTTLVVIAVPSMLLGLLVYWMAGSFGLTIRQRLVGTLAYCLGTSAFPYANNFVGHQLAAFLLFGAFAALYAMRRGFLQRGWLVGVGFLLGYAAITEYPTVLIGAILGLYALLTLGRPIDAFARLALGAVPPLVALGLYDMAVFGTPLPVGYAYSTLWTDAHQTGFMSLTYPHLSALWGITFGVHRGLFFLSPFLLLSVLGYRRLLEMRSCRAEFWVLLLAPAVFFLFNASSAMWQGGFAVGPRYLVPALPFLALPAALGLADAWRRSWLRPVVVAAVGWSFFAVWAETIGGQSFPDYTRNPLLDFSIPRLAAGDIARNVGTVLGLGGWLSLVPLLVVVIPALWFAGAHARASLDAGGSPEPADWAEGRATWALP
jgi:hypothetical protein